MGVITAAVDRGPWTFEGSIFQSTEPDENRWDIVDFGALDSWSARVWYEPSSAWQIQVSHGYLGHPERLEFQSVHRTTGSVSWLRSGGRGYTAVTAMLGHNQKSLDGGFTAALVEATHRERALTVYGRAETLQVETLVLQTRTAFHSHSMPTPKDVVTAATAGLVGDLPSWRGVEMGVGADVTAYVVPGALRPYYGTTRCRRMCSCACGRRLDTWGACGTCAWRGPYTSRTPNAITARPATISQGAIAPALPDAVTSAACVRSSIAPSTRATRDWPVKVEASAASSSTHPAPSAMRPPAAAPTSRVAKNSVPSQLATATPASSRSRPISRSPAWRSSSSRKARSARARSSAICWRSSSSRW